ncbi:Serine/threonine protein kinase [Sandaracinus amylolyticus]|nr:Serine/threonine protein kinase [Sandaracinus amylolyticus]
MPERFGAYEIEKRLGAGGMAEVFLAQRRGPEGFAKRVALKRVLPGYNQDPEFVRLFQDEARLAARLDHPHIAGIHDFGEVEGTWFMAMEYVDGSDLRTLLSGLGKLSQPMPTDLVLLVAADLASALLYAHEVEIDGRPARIIHRDVTPSNILVSTDGAIRLADFGIAKAASHGHHTRTGIVKGKVPYMPPEQALGENMDHRVDLFALGVVLFECLAGKRPYVGVTELDTLQKISKGQHARLNDLAPHTPPALAEVVERLIRPDPSARFENAADVLDALAASPPPTNARRLLGNLVKRVQREAPKSISEMRGFVKTESLPDEPANDRTRTAGELAQRALAMGAEPREDVARALDRAAQEKSWTPPAQNDAHDPRTVPAGRRVNVASEGERTGPVTSKPPLPSTRTRPAVAMESDSSVPVAESEISIPQVVAPQPRVGVSLGAWIALAMSLGIAFVGVVGAAGVWWIRTRTPVAVVTPLPVVTTPPPSAPPAAPPIVEAPAPVSDPVVATTATPVPEPTPEPVRPRPTTRDRDRPEREPRVTASSNPTPPPPEVPPGRVSVVALPMGEVTIDGRDHGTSPVTATLRPGHHVIVVRNGEREERRSIEVASEVTERVVVRFPLDG